MLHSLPHFFCCCHILLLLCIVSCMKQATELYRIGNISFLSYLLYAFYCCVFNSRAPNNDPFHKIHSSFFSLHFFPVFFSFDFTLSIKKKSRYQRIKVTRNFPSHWTATKREKVSQYSAEGNKNSAHNWMKREKSATSGWFSEVKLWPQTQ